MKRVLFTTERRDGNARAPKALDPLLRKRGVPGFAARAEQVHGQKVIWIPRLHRETIYKGVDGFLTSAVQQPLAIFTADCVPVFLEVPSFQVVGLLHAGWRGVRSGILAEAVRSLRRRINCRAFDIKLRLGPSIGPCCFEVQWDVAQHFPATRRRSNGRWVVDLAQEIRNQARRQGLRLEGVKEKISCTFHGRRHFSFRRDATTDRQVSIIAQLQAES